jgi:heat shock protein HtpX
MNLYDQIASNKRRSLLLISLLMILIAMVVYVFSRAFHYDALALTGVALIITGLYSWFSYYFSDKMVLSLSGARQISKQDAPDLFNLVENLCIGDGLPMPKVFIMNDGSPNAFATGRDPDHASIVFTTGILNKLEKAELEGVAAHELSHVKNYDTRMTTLVVVLVGVIALLADWFLRMSFFGGLNRDDDNRNNSNGLATLLAIILAILTPIIAQLMQLAISRQREYLADASGALLTRYPEGLARALEKISTDTEPLDAANNATASLYISNPLKSGGASTWFSSLFDTHPPIKDRIARLRAM